jgi:hypothetical protein
MPEGRVPRVPPPASVGSWGSRGSSRTSLRASTAGAQEVNSPPGSRRLLARPVRRVTRFVASAGGCLVSGGSCQRATVHPCVRSVVDARPRIRLARLWGTVASGGALSALITFALYRRQRLDSEEFDRRRRRADGAADLVQAFQNDVNLHSHTFGQGQSLEAQAQVTRAGSRIVAASQGLRNSRMDWVSPQRNPSDRVKQRARTRHQAYSAPTPNLRVGGESRNGCETSPAGRLTPELALQNVRGVSAYFADSPLMTA